MDIDRPAMRFVSDARPPAQQYNKAMGGLYDCRVT